MNATERKTLTALLNAGDTTAALAYLQAPATTVRRSTADPKPAKRRGKLNKFAPAPTLLGVAPCGCAVWLDQAVMCKGHEATRDELHVRELIHAHESSISAYETARFGPPRHPRNWSAFIFQVACRYQHCN